ncbi:MAG: PIN domain nuclease of toxin-antitoxin system [Candidatus Latescibacterota bacterium]|jgi:PIN domain nuclease of toxin-antitoxin system|tara:strand:+ start:29 stop:415 length:387 start_codon:yes stop_codon:yes gene_type:complete
MKVLLDTHALLWWWTDDPQLPEAPRVLIADPFNELLISSATAWEVSTKYRLGKLPAAEEIAENFAALVEESHMTPLPITIEHALRAGALERHHRDPFDRMIIAQSQVEGAAIVTKDAAFANYDVDLLW